MNVRGSRELITSEEFKSLMQRLAQAWNGANARTAANCFTDDGIYLDPPDKEICRQGGIVRVLWRRRPDSDGDDLALSRFRRTRAEGFWRVQL